MAKLHIDRFEDDVAVCVTDAGEQILLEKSLLPLDANEQDWISETQGSYSVDKEVTHSHRESNHNLLHKLLARKPEPALLLRPFCASDVETFRQWLYQDYILKWYHDPEDWMEEVVGQDGQFAWIHHYIAMLGDHPIGFCQYYDCFEAQDLEDWYQVEVPGQTFSIDYLIGKLDYLGKGYGKEIVHLLIQKIKDQEESAEVILVQPEPENFASCAVLRQNGFVFSEEKKYFWKPLK